MQVCIQDPSNSSCYVIADAELAKFAVEETGPEREVDVLFVCPGNSLVQELPSSRLTDSVTPTIQIVDPDHNKNWVVDFAHLANYRVASPPVSIDETIWFAMPSAREVLAAVPMFRRALVQNSC
jgi:hypothetical protein